MIIDGKTKESREKYVPLSLCTLHATWTDLGANRIKVDRF
jgi:hypothetical protein